MSDVSLFELTSSSSSTPSDCDFGLELTCEVSEYAVPGRTQCWRMRIWVSDWNNVDANAFVYRRGEVDPVTSDITDTFVAVASPADLTEYQAGSPAEDQSFYRLGEVDLISRNRELLNQTWELIKEDRNELIRSITSMCEMSPYEVSRYGIFPETETPVTPVVPETPSSDVAPTCPTDDYTSLKITVSDDLDFPVDTELTPIADPIVAPDCYRQWTVDGAVTGKTLILTTSMVNHSLDMVLDGAPITSTGLADGYLAILNYTRGLGEPHTISILGIV